MTMFLSRLSVSRKPSVQALNALLLPANAGDRTDAHHRLLWTLFADDPDRRRDFLWREDREGEFLVLSARMPVPNDLFDRVETKAFAPNLSKGDRLSFVLRANATRSKKGGSGAQGQRVDVVMDALFTLPPANRAAQRMVTAQTEGTAWLGRQQDRNGFHLLSCDVTDYAVHALPGHRGKRSHQPQFGILDFHGEMAVADPVALLRMLTQGLGRAKAYGCGLMLIRRST
jgi:CRISPR system Cascade subunit CasE